MTVESMLAFSAAMFVLAVTPGPGVFASVSQALSSGFRSTLAVIAGMVLGDLMFLSLAIFGLSAAAYALGDLFFVIKLLGGAYLIWFGWKMWSAGPRSYRADRGLEGRSGWQRFLGGLFITLGNPKVILFYAGFLPTFMDLSSLRAIDIVLVGGLVTVILFSVMGVYSFSAARARRLFTSYRAARNLNRTAGTVMIGAGLVIATR